MGHVFVEAELTGTRTDTVRMLVDAGATHTILPADIARRLGVRKSSWKRKVGLAHGTKRSMHCGLVRVRLAGREAGDTVLLGPAGTEPLLGVEALEALGLAVDPRSGKVKKTRAFGVLLVGARAGQPSASQIQPLRRK